MEFAEHISDNLTKGYFKSGLLKGQKSDCRGNGKEDAL